MPGSTSSAAIEARPQLGAAASTVTRHFVGADTYGPWIFLNAVSSITCVPGGGGTMKAQFSYDIPLFVNRDNAANRDDGYSSRGGPPDPIDWAPGDVSVMTTLPSPSWPTAVRFKASTVAGYGFVGQ